MTEQKKSYDYINQSRGHKTKGNSYKDRYVDIPCPEPGCGHQRAYKDTWKTKYAYTCMKRSCRHKWYVTITQEDRDKEEQLKSMEQVQD